MKAKLRATFEGLNLMVLLRINNFQNKEILKSDTRINFVSLLSVTYTDRIKAWKFRGKLHKRTKYYNWPFRKESLRLPTLDGPPRGGGGGEKKKKKKFF